MNGPVVFLPGFFCFRPSRFSKPWRSFFWNCVKCWNVGSSKSAANNFFRRIASCNSARVYPTRRFCSCKSAGANFFCQKCSCNSARGKLLQKISSCSSATGNFLCRIGSCKTASENFSSKNGPRNFVGRDAPVLQILRFAAGWQHPRTQGYHLYVR